MKVIVREGLQPHGGGYILLKGSQLVREWGPIQVEHGVHLKTDKKSVVMPDENLLSSLFKDNLDFSMKRSSYE